MVVAEMENTWANCSKKLEDFTSKPENFLHVQHELAEEIKKLTKHIYDNVKNIEIEKPKDALQELIIENFDDEQIWQQLELQNEEKCSMFISQVSKLIAVKDKLVFPMQEESDEGASSPELGEGGDSDVLESDSDVSDQEITTKKPKKRKPAKRSRARESTIVDDKFFKLRDMEAFLEQEERSEPKTTTADSSSDEESVDLFEDDVSEQEDDEDDDDGEENSGARYKDFFDPVEGESEEEEGAVGEEEEEGDEGKEEEEGAVSEEEEEGAVSEEEEEGAEREQKGPKVRFEEASSSDESDTRVKSSFETRQEKLQQRIDKIHEEALGEKPWQLKGEVSATKRPQNSLLEEVLEFDMTSRPAPVMTEQTTMKLEDIIRQRIKDKAWDDVERKLKPVEAPSEYKKKLVLDQEKSKLSLAQIYEKEYLKKQKDVSSSNKDDEDEEQEEPPEHVEIRKMMHKLFTKLNALSNYHFTPKPAAPEIRVVTNLPAISVEEVAPVAASDATLLAPEEIKRKPRGELLAKEERSATDKKRERRKKKKHQHAKKIAEEKKERETLKQNPDGAVKLSKQQVVKQIDKAAKAGTIKRMEVSSSGNKSLKSSSAFFSQLQDEVTSLVKTKSNDAKRKKAKESIHSAKKLKL